MGIRRRLIRAAAHYYMPGPPPVPTDDPRPPPDKDGTGWCQQCWRFGQMWVHDGLATCNYCSKDHPI